MERYVRQAVLIVHGMGEQRPLEALNEFIGAALKPAPDGSLLFYSRPDRVTDSYEARRYLAPRSAPAGVEDHAQTEFYEYHWAHLMQGNKLTDLWPTFRRLLLQWPSHVPRGLIGLWIIVWALIAGAVAFFWLGPGSNFDLSTVTLSGLITGLVGGGVVAVILTFLIADVIPGWLTSSFVDVVRYLDTSPRSYEVRRQIREGIVDLLQGLHDAHSYQRIVVVAHSLGTYIAYDAITYLWGQMNTQHAGPPNPPVEHGLQPDGLRELEEAASAVEAGQADAASYQAAQRRLWRGLRHAGNPWLITDFVSLGSPMYFAHQLYTRDRGDFDDRIAKRELPTCPPLAERSPKNNVNDLPIWYSWLSRGRRVLYEGAPFAVVRWTNLWFPARLGFFGDWFGGSLRDLFGAGIKEVALEGNRPRSRWPGLAHALYFHFTSDPGPTSVTTYLREAIGLASTSWLNDTLDGIRPESAAPEGTP